jgi:hypothetical protein
MPKTPPWTYVVAFASPIAISAAGYGVCVATKGSIGLTIATYAILTVPLVYWVHRLARARVPEREKLTWGTPQLSVLYCVFVVAMISIAFATYALTNNRFAEFAIALAGAVPGALFLSRKRLALQRPPRSNEAPALRTLAISQMVSPVLFSFSLALMLAQRHYYGSDVETLRNVAIAAGFFLIPMSPITAYYAWLRYGEARRAANAMLIGAR